MSLVRKNVVCPFCGCLCDDIELTVEGDAITKARNSCTIGSTKFLNYGKDRLLRPRMREEGTLTEVRIDRAIMRSAEILAKASYPLLYGWSSTSCEANEVGVELADYLGGVIDNTSSVCHGPTILGVHDVGESTCTLGEVRNRADLIVYWGCNPVHSHPRHMTRYTVTSKGLFRQSRKERTLIVVDVRKTHTAKLADRFIRIEPGRDFELLSALRMLVMDQEIDAKKVAGIPVNKLEDLAELLISCEFGALFFGLGLTMSAGKNRNIDAALSLVRDLNRRTKFVIMPMRGHFNVAGANKVSTWETGYPFAVDFSHGYPTYNPGDASAVDLLSRGECDAALVVASDPVSNFPKAAVRNLLDIPLIVIDPHETPTSMVANVSIPSAFVGIEAVGTAYRMDGVPLMLKKVLEPPKDLLPDTEILRRILKAVRGIRGRM